MLLISLLLVAWDGQAPVYVPQLYSEEQKVWCGYVHHGRRFWRVYTTSTLVSIYQTVKCPDSVEPTMSEIERLKTALPFKPR